MYFSGKDGFWQVTDAFLRHLALIWFNCESTNTLAILCLPSIPFDECIVVTTTNTDATTNSWCYELVLYHFFGDAHTFTQVCGIRHRKFTIGSPWSGTLQSWKIMIGVKGKGILILLSSEFNRNVNGISAEKYNPQILNRFKTDKSFLSNLSLTSAEKQKPKSTPCAWCKCLLRAIDGAAVWNSLSKLRYFQPAAPSPSRVFASITRR